MPGPAQRPQDVHHPLMPGTQLIQLPGQLGDTTTVRGYLCHRMTSLRDAFDDRKHTDRAGHATSTALGRGGTSLPRPTASALARTSARAEQTSLSGSEPPKR